MLLHVHPFTNLLVKKLFGNDLVGRFAKYVIKYYYYKMIGIRRSWGLGDPQYFVGRGPIIRGPSLI